MLRKVIVLFEILFGSELKIKILRELNSKKIMRFSEIRDSLLTGAGSTKSALDFLTENSVIIKIEEGPKKIYFKINEKYEKFINDLFESEKDFYMKDNKIKVFEKFFSL